VGRRKEAVTELERSRNPRTQAARTREWKNHESVPSTAHPLYPQHCLVPGDRRCGNHPLCLAV